MRSLALGSFVALLCHASTAFAYAGGATSADFAGPAGCANCHAPNTPSASVSLRFASAPVFGEPVDVTVEVEGEGSAGGFLLIVSGGTLEAGAGSVVVEGEATQSAALALPASWTMSWTPDATGPASYTLWATSVDGDGTLAGDHPRRSPIVGSVTVLRAQGDACTTSEECGSGFCVDGVCCDSACGGTCQACSVAVGGSADGSCTGIVGVDCIATASCSELGAAPFFMCTCPPGTTGAGDADGCANVDECAGHPCGPFGVGGQDGQGCTETSLGSWSAPGYTCSCQVGYLQDGTPRTCRVGNECSMGTDDCDNSPAAVCNDPNPSPTSLNDFTCTCPGPGWRNDPVRQGHGAAGCIDVDECAENIAGCDVNAACTNVTGSFICTCNAPDWADSGSGTCVPTDHCARGSDDCDDNAICTSMPPTFTCACGPGFSDAPGTSGGRDCVPADECAEGSDDCDEHATCTNTDEGYLCECDPGWGGSGTSCEDVDECTSGALDCAGTEVCENQTGAPAECVCPTGTMRDTSGGCVPVPDAGSGTGDAGGAVLDAGTRADGGTASPASGCTCRAGANQQQPHAWLLFAALAVARMRRRR
ncbi:MAG: calcium-binding EGF-like domain-containing protein [Polyangiales bacterium]